MDEKHSDLYNQMVDAEINAKNNHIYTILLMTLGTMIIFSVTIALILQNLSATPLTTAAFITGFFLFACGNLWLKRDHKKMQRLREDYEQLGNIQEEGERISPNN